MAILVKICGLKTPGALEVALEAGADLVGFVFFPPSPRHLDGLTARALGRRVEGPGRQVGLAVDPHDFLLATIIQVLPPDVLQLPGSEPAAGVCPAEQRVGPPVMNRL